MKLWPTTKIKKMRLVNLFIIGLVAVVLQSCDNTKTESASSTTSKPEQTSSDQKSTASNADIGRPTETDFLVYKSPTCGCCNDWLTHLQSNGFTTDFVQTENLSEIKEKLGIPQSYASCHTAVSRQGYVFEGHIPAHVIQRFLAERPPNAIGLAVPGMPIGSPGMEMGDRFEPYDVILLRKDGKTELFTRISAPLK